MSTPMTIEEIKALVETDAIPRCAICGEKMRRNIPRLSDSCGWVHDATDQLECGPRREIQWCVILKREPQ